jgi:hypothetical protein
MGACGKTENGKRLTMQENLTCQGNYSVLHHKTHKLKTGNILLPSMQPQKQPDSHLSGIKKQTMKSDSNQYQVAFRHMRMHCEQRL